MTAEGLASGLATWLDVSGAAVLTYFILISTSYLVLLVLATLEFVRHVRRHDFAGYDDALASPLTLPVSVLLPAHDEEVGIVESVQAMLGLRYAELEVVVVLVVSLALEALTRAFGGELSLVTRATPCCSWASPTSTRSC